MFLAWSEPGQSPDQATGPLSNGTGAAPVPLPIPRTLLYCVVVAYLVFFISGAPGILRFAEHLRENHGGTTENPLRHFIYFQLTFLHPPVRVTVGEVRYSIEIDVGGGKGSILQTRILRKIFAKNGPHV